MSATLPVLMRSSASVTCMDPTGSVVSPSLPCARRRTCARPRDAGRDALDDGELPLAERGQLLAALCATNEVAHKAKHLGSVAHVVVHQHHREGRFRRGSHRPCSSPPRQPSSSTAAHRDPARRSPRHWAPTRPHPHPQRRQREVLVGDVPLVGRRPGGSSNPPASGAQAEQVHRADGVRAEHAVDLLGYQTLRPPMSMMLARLPCAKPASPQPGAGPPLPRRRGDDRPAEEAPAANGTRGRTGGPPARRAKSAFWSDCASARCAWHMPGDRAARAAKAAVASSS